MSSQTALSESRTEPEANALCELPSDVLQHIFSLVLYTLKNSPQSAKREALISLCLVCFSWNQAALNDARLWGKVVDPCDKSLERFTEHLARSKGAPLEILTAVVLPDPRCRINPNYMPPQWTALLSESHRLKNLHLTLPVQMSDTVLFGTLMRAPAGSLEHLTLGFKGRLDLAVKKTAPKSEMFFSGLATPLRSLTLGNVIFPPRLIPFESLEFLRLKYTLRGVRLEAHVRGWWDLVCSGEMRKLEKFYLENASFFSVLPSHRCAAITQGAMSPNLKKISLEGDIDACVWLLDRDYLELPPFCNLELSLRPSDGHTLLYPNTNVPAVTGPEGVLSSVVCRILEKDSSHPCVKLSIIQGAESKFVHRSGIRRITISHDCPIGFSLFLDSLILSSPSSLEAILNMTATTRYTEQTQEIVERINKQMIINATGPTDISESDS